MILCGSSCLIQEFCLYNLFKNIKRKLKIKKKKNGPSNYLKEKKKTDIKIKR